MVTRAWGVGIIILSVLVIIFNTFLYLNSSAYFDYNQGTISMARAGVFFPYFGAVCTLIFGLLLFNDRVLGEEE